MIWILLAATTAFSEAIKDTLSKKGLVNVDEYTVAWSRRLLSLPVLIPLLFFIPIPEINEKFWQSLLIYGFLVFFSSIAYMKALKSSDLSITLPILSFTPLFLLVTSPLIIGEFPSFTGLIGMVLIVLGAYSMNISDRHKSLLAPIASLFKEPGPRFMLLVAFIWSLSSNFEKVGVQSASPIFWVIISEALMAVILFPPVLIKSPNFLGKIAKNWKTLAPISLAHIIGYTAQMTAVTLTLVPYVISIKRTSILIGVIFGYLFFKEKRIRERLSAAAIMFAGIVIITLFA